MRIKNGSEFLFNEKFIFQKFGKNCMSVVVSYKKQFLAGFLFLIIILFAAEGITRNRKVLFNYK
jgi:hypothetical protein